MAALGGVEESYSVRLKEAPWTRTRFEPNSYAHDMPVVTLDGVQSHVTVDAEA